MKVVWFSIVILVVSASMVVAHPSDGYLPNELDEDYGTPDYHTGPVEGIGDLTFTCPYPDPSTLSREEQYMIAGTANGPGGFPLRAWVDEIGTMLAIICHNEGSIPDELSEEVLTQARGGQIPVGEWKLDLYKSPLTDEFPRLNAKEFSPGNLYSRVLTEDEMRAYAQGNPDLQSVWFEHRIDRPGTPEDGAEAAPAPAIYLRFYGWNDVVYETVTMMWAVSAPVSGG